LKAFGHTTIFMSYSLMDMEALLALHGWVKIFPPKRWMFSSLTTLTRNPFHPLESYIWFARPEKSILVALEVQTSVT
jgi:muconolactone delta-isomerase